MERGRGQAGLPEGAGAGPRHEEGGEYGDGAAERADGGEAGGRQAEVQGHVLK